MSSVILTDIIQTVLETSECCLTNTNNNMHILATETEEQAIYSGHLSSKLLNSAPAAIRSSPGIENMLTRQDTVVQRSYPTTQLTQSLQTVSGKTAN